jgi:hypothetical protein
LEAQPHAAAGDRAEPFRRPLRLVARADDHAQRHVRRGYAYAQLVELRFGAGPSFYRSESQDGGGHDSGLGYVLDGSASARLTERTRASVSAGHGIGPGDDDGVADEVTQLGLGFDHRLSRFVDLLLDATYYRQRTLVSAREEETGEDRGYLEVSPSLVWRLWTRLEASLIYRYRRNEEQGENADSSGVFLRLAYQLPEGRGSW